MQIKIGDQVRIRCDDGSFSAETFAVLEVRRGMVATSTGSFNRCDVKKA